MKLEYNYNYREKFYYVINKIAKLIWKHWFFDNDIYENTTKRYVIWYEAWKKKFYKNDTKSGKREIHQ